MRSDVLLVAYRDRLPRIECRGAVAARRTEPYTVHLVSAAATPVVSRMVNAASFLDVAAVPGMIVSFLGTNLGPATGVAASPNSSGVFDKQLANVKVIFDTFEAPVLYVSATQVNAIVPYLVAPRVTTTVQVEVNGVRSRPLELRVAAAAPAIFLLNAAGQGAILNQDNSVNGSGNPAARESTWVRFMFGQSFNSTLVRLKLSAMETSRHLARRF